jgi:hypothetical protein
MRVRSLAAGAKHGSPTLVRGEPLIGLVARADSGGMSIVDTSNQALRDRALVLATELGIDDGAWYLRVLEEGREDVVDRDLGALVRAYGELQRVTGRTDLRGEWRSLADRLWHDG